MRTLLTFYRLARVMIRYGDQSAAFVLMSRTCFRATPEQVHLKVKAMRAAVQQSVDIANSLVPTFFQRLCSAFSVPVFHRAFSEPFLMLNGKLRH